MLVLGRNLEESIDINGGFENGGITILVCKSTSTGVRLGIKAGPEFKILRGELRSTTCSQPVSEEATARIQTGQAG